MLFCFIYYSIKKPRSPPPRQNNDYDVDGEQISDGEMEDSTDHIKSIRHDSQVSHEEDLSDVSDLDSADEDSRQKKARPSQNKSKENGPATIERTAANEKHNDNEDDKNSASGAVALADETEQLDFEADGQWKDVLKEDGEETKESRESKDIKKDDMDSESDKKSSNRKDDHKKDRDNDKRRGKDKVFKISLNACE